MAPIYCVQPRLKLDENWGESGTTLAEFTPPFSVSSFIILFLHLCFSILASSKLHLPGSCVYLYDGQKWASCPLMNVPKRSSVKSSLASHPVNLLAGWRHFWRCSNISNREKMFSFFLLRRIVTLCDTIWIFCAAEFPRDQTGSDLLWTAGCSHIFPHSPGQLNFSSGRLATSVHWGHTASDQRWHLFPSSPPEPGRLRPQDSSFKDWVKKLGKTAICSEYSSLTSLERGNSSHGG